MGSTATRYAADAYGAEVRSVRKNVSDGAGVLLLGSCATWSLVTATGRDGRPEGVLLAVLAVAAGYAAGRISGALLPVAAPCAGASAGLLLVVLLPGLSPGTPYAVPLGHAGATAALLALATGAACCAAWAASAPAPRLALRVLAAGTVLTGAAVGSAAGCAASAAVLLCSLAAGAVPRRGAALAGLAAAAFLTAVAVCALAGGALPGGLAGALEGRLTPHRVRLWRDALDLAHGHGALGVGPGRFGELSATAAQAVPADGTPHSALFQQASEEGAVGVLLLAAAFCWALYALWRSPRPTRVAVTAGAALTALAVIASAGNALSFTAVTAGAGLLAGWATARPWSGEDTPAPRR